MTDGGKNPTVSATFYHKGEERYGLDRGNQYDYIITFGELSPASQAILT